MTDQEFFDGTLRHLVAQRKMSWEDGKCLYRGPEGRTCAIGHWIADDAVAKQFDRAGTLASHPRVLAAAGLERLQGVLAVSLQCLHDDIKAFDYLGFINWGRARAIAEHHKLGSAIIDTLEGEEGGRRGALSPTLPA